MNLRDALLQSLRSLPGVREFHIHVLVSAPRKHASLYPYASPRPRIYLQDILVLLSEQANPDSPHVLVSAIEASLYNIPSTSCSVLYVSKVDSTAQGTAPSPTSTLVRAFLAFFARPGLDTLPAGTQHLWIQLFARAQRQYLFPNSADYERKRPLSDVRLCAWWKRILGEVAGDLAGGHHHEEGLKIRLYYVLPGYNELEATQSLGSVSPPPSSSASPQWTYGHPYSQTDIPLPCPSPAKGDSDDPKLNLGHFIPSFDDDPKSRFMDEIACTTNLDGVRSPPKKRQRLNGPDGQAETKKTDENTTSAVGELGKVSPNEFWERMSFRQECIAGAVTGFFALGISSPSSITSSSLPPPLAPQPGQVSSQINKRIITSLLTSHEFSTVERAVKATSILEDAIKGLCEGIPSAPAALEQSRPRTPEPETPRHLVIPSTPPRRGVYIPDVSPNPFPEPVASLETYRSHIYGSVCVSNSVVPVELVQGASDLKTDPPVTVLTARKKKKKP